MGFRDFFALLYSDVKSSQVLLLQSASSCFILKDLLFDPLFNWEIFFFRVDDDGAGTSGSDAKRAKKEKKEKKKKKKKKSKKRDEEDEDLESQDSMFGDGDDSISEGEALDYLDEIEAKLERKKKRKSD